MSIVGSFDPSAETYPTPSVTSSINVVPDSSFELGTSTIVAREDYDGLRVTNLGVRGTSSYRLTVDSTNTGIYASVDVLLASTAAMLSGGLRFSYQLYVPPGSPFIGKRLDVAWITNPSYIYNAASGTQVLVSGWNALSGSFTSTQVTNSTVGGQVRLQLAFLYDTDPGSNQAYVAGNNGQQLWIDEILVKEGTTSAAWVPAIGEPFYDAGQQWVVSAAGTFQGTLLSSGDIVTQTAPGWIFEDDTTWEVTQQIGGVAAALQTKPSSLTGVPIGLGDWRVGVEILLSIDSTSRWGVAKWGESQWNGLAWYDLSEFVRGAEWTRGASEFGGRPEVGVLDVTLANEDRQFSPWNGVSAFQDATVLDGDDVLPGFFAPGTIVRVVAFSPSGQIDPLTVDYDNPVPIYGAVPTLVKNDNFSTFDTGYWYRYGGTDPTSDGTKLTFTAGQRIDRQAVAPPEEDREHIFLIDSYTPHSGNLIRFGETSKFPWRYDLILGPTNPSYEFWDSASSIASGSFTAAGKWFRFRHFNGDFTLATSADGVTWTTHHTATYAPGVDSGYTPDITAGAGGGIVLDNYTQNTLVYGIVGYDGDLDPDTIQSWVPQFTGVVESWEDASVGVGADSMVNVTAIETLSTMAAIDELAVGAVGLDDQPEERIQRLLDAAGWEFGDVDSVHWIRNIAPSSRYDLQSTDMANNRISELYLTADSVGGVIRSDRSGAPIFHNTPETGGLGYAIQRGPEAANLEGLAYEFFGGLLRSVFVADSVRVANDNTALENDVRLTYVGGSQIVDSDEVSVQRYRQRRIYERNDLICKTTQLLDYLIETRLEARARRPLRLAALALHSAHTGALPAIVGLDVGAQIDVHLPPLPTHTVVAQNNYIDGMTHRLTPLNGSEVIWTVDLTFGVQQGIENIEI